MFKKSYRYFYCLLLCVIIFSTKTVAQNDNTAKQELLAAFEQVKNAFPLPVQRVCVINEKATVEELLGRAEQYNTIGNWPCCQKILQALSNKTQQLGAIEKIHLLLAQAEYFNTHQVFDSAILYASLVNQRAINKTLQPEKTRALLVLSLAALRRRNMSTAYSWADSALQLSRKTDDELLQGKALLQMAFCARRNFTSSSHRAFPYYLQAIEMAEKSRDSLTLFSANLFLADDNFENEQWQIGLPYFKKAMAIALNSSNVHLAAILFNGLAFPLAKKGLDQEALFLYNKSLQLAKQQHFLYAIQHGYFAIAGTLQNLHQYDSALVYANLADSVPGVDSLISNVWWLKADIYSDMNNYKAAAAAYSKALNWANTDFLYRNQEQLSGYEAKLKTSEKELLVVQEKKRTIQLEWIIGGVAFLLVMAALAFIFQSRSRKKLANQNAIIQKQREQLEKSLSEKDILLKEIHHRVKNNLSVISSLLELQSSGIEDQKAKAAIAEGQSRVRSIALIHQRLYQHENLAAIEFSGFVNDMITDVSGVFKIPGQKINTSIQVPETLLDIDTAVPLGLIMNELLTNSFKYAFTADKEGVIAISLKTTQRGNYTLTYLDNGPGMPDDFDLKKTKSLGLRLIHRLSNQIGGSAQYTSVNGSQFVISFKDSFTRNKEA